MDDHSERQRRPRLWLVDTTGAKPAWKAGLREAFPISDSPEQADYIVVIGGDGSMLRSIHQFFEARTPFFGLNAGTRGFLMNDVEDLDDLPALFEDVRVEELWLLQADIVMDEGTRRVFGFNDIWLERSTGQMLKMYVTIDGERQAARVVGDGMLFSTPQGSTGYSRALRGKVILPGVPVLQMNPMACVINKIPLGSLLLSDQSVITIDIEEADKRPARLFHDGILFEERPVRRFTVRKSDRTVKLGFTHKHTLKARVMAWQFQL